MKSLVKLLFLVVVCLCFIRIFALPGRSRKKVSMSKDSRLASNSKGVSDKITLKQWNINQVISTHGVKGNGTELDLSVWDIIYRALYLLILFQPVLWTMPLALVSSTFRNMVWFELLAVAVAHSGAAFIKWGQWASTRPDMFPEQFCAALSELHANGRVHSWDFTKAQIRHELGGDVTDVFSTFETRPIASGSVAQVYKATYRGEDVAVKVRHPGVAEQIQLDFVIMKALARWVETIPAFHWLNLSESLLQFSATIASQTNLAAEGIHLAIFNRNFAQQKSRIGFPVPILLTESVLVESFEEGLSVSEYTSLYSTQGKRARRWASGAELLPWISASSDAGNVPTGSGHPQVNRKIVRGKGEMVNSPLGHAIIVTGEDLYLHMMLVDNLMHADLHPGNILIQKKDVLGVESHNVRIVLVDAGMVARLSRREQDHFVGLLQAMGEGSGREAARHVMRFSEEGESQYSQSRIRDFEDAMETYFAKHCRGYGKGIDLGVVLRGVLALVRDHQITIEANYATLVMNALCLDGLASQLVPGYRVLDAAKPLLQYHRVTHRLMGRKWGALVFRKTLPLVRLLKNKQDQSFARALELGINLHSLQTSDEKELS